MPQIMPGRLRILLNLRISFMHFLLANIRLAEKKEILLPGTNMGRLVASSVSKGLQSKV